MDHAPTSSIPLVARAERHRARIALVDERDTLTYSELLARSARAAAGLLQGGSDLQGARVVFLVPPSCEYAVVQWGIWRAGGIAVPLCTTHPAPELEYTITDSGATIGVVHPQFADLLAPLAHRHRLRLVASTELCNASVGAIPSSVSPERGAMLLYTSGTTGKPKGVLTSHAQIAAQIGSVVEAWAWSAEDRVLHVLPLHHLHGILNLLCAALWSGASCEFLPRFDADRVWERIETSNELTLFMAVPTIYAKLIAAFEQAPPERRARLRASCRRLRLMVSGSAALPAATLERFAEISGHTLLERYGMTEFGMGLGNPLHGPRRPGSVGRPFPGIEVRLVDPERGRVEDGDPGEIQVKGAGVFSAYWSRPEATRAAFTEDGWFKTGDLAVREQGCYRILGRESIDILKTGGFKVSALEIEEVLREHPAVEECAVIGVPDEVWGQRVGAVVVLRPGHTLDVHEAREFCKRRLAPYKAPSRLRSVPALPRNAMGKVTKSELLTAFQGLTG